MTAVLINADIAADLKKISPGIWQGGAIDLTRIWAHVETSVHKFQCQWTIKENLTGSEHDCSRLLNEGEQ